jgi:hypothetical protein
LLFGPNNGKKSNTRKKKQHDMKKLKILKAFYTDHLDETFENVQITRFIYNDTERPYKISFDYLYDVKNKGSIILHSKTGFKYEGEDSTHLDGKYELVFEVFRNPTEFIMLGTWKDKNGFVGDWVIRATSRE